MKISNIIVVIYAGISWLFLPGCDDEAKPDRNPGIHDSMMVTQNYTYVLENMLDFQNEEEFKRVYSNDAVKYDTIWGAEGFFSFGTLLRTDSTSRIEIYWKHDSLRKDVVSVTLVSESDWYGDSLPPGMWRSSTGIKLGMSLEEVEKINGRPFSFSGFGWDYAGGLMSWEGGTLEGKGISIQLAEGTGYDSLPQKEYEAILGDVPVMSNNATARKSGARVWSISVAKVQ